MIIVSYYIIARVYYNKEGGRVSYSSIVPCTAVVRVQARLMIFTMCGVICGVIIDIRDYVNGIGNCSREQYMHH